MGTYSSLDLDGFGVISSKSHVIPEVMALFRESDKFVNEETGEFRYSAKVQHVKDRLDLMGVTLDKARSRHEKFRCNENGIRDGLYLFANETLIEELTFDRWLEEFRAIKSERLRKTFIPHDGRDLPPVRQYLLDSEADHLWGYPPYLFEFLRAALEVCNEDGLVVQDLTDLCRSGYYELGADICTMLTQKSLEAHFAEIRPIIVLTEGRSDIVALRGALDLLYPHLIEYFKFMDFEATKAEGNAGALVRTVKAFAGVGIANRIIAWFDNDSAATAALQVLKSITLPSNIVIMQYPPLVIAERYPTLGPTGMTELNVNGLAGSIELYFGEDVLRQSDGSLTPVQWTGYEASLRRYQGEVLNKAELQASFKEKLRRSKDDHSVAASLDWSGMKAIIDKMRRAFH